MSNGTTHHGIVVGVDGSPASKVAVDWAARDAALRRVPLTVVHVLPTAEVRMWPELPMPDEYWRMHERQSHQIIRDALTVVDEAIAGHDPITVEHKTISGNTVPTLVDLSKDAQMLVVGSAV